MVRTKFVYNVLTRLKVSRSLLVQTSTRCFCQTTSNIVKSPIQMEIPKMSMHEFVYQDALRFPHNVATECGITGKQYTFEQVRQYSNRIASALQNKFKLAPLDCAAVVLPNIPEFPLIFLANSEAGLITTTVNPLYLPEEISRQLKSSGAKLAFTTTVQYKTVAEAVKLTGEKIPIVVLKSQQDENLPEGAINFQELVDPSLPRVKHVDIDPEQTVVLPYSSGTTGLAKGAQLSHRNLVSNMSQLQHPLIELSKETTADFQETMICVLPFFHIFGLTVVMMHSLRLGLKLITLPRFEPKSYLKTITSHKDARVLYVVPPLVLFLGSEAVAREHLSNVDFVLTGGAPSGQKDSERLKEKVKDGANVIQGYGLTETSPTVFSAMKPRYHKLASVGVPVPNTEIRVVHVDNKQDLGVNQVGEIYVRGPQVMKGYLNNDQINAEAFDGPDWFKTGDLGYYDDDGEFYIVDRLKELIKVKGFQVPPAELEELLRSHSSIEDAAVIGVPDDKSGELPRAYVALKPNKQMTEDEVKQFVAEHVVEYKQLNGGVEFMDKIPKSASGKILRKELRQKYQQGKS